MSLELHYGSFQRECCKRSLTANRWQYSPPKTDGRETTASHITAQPTCWKRIKRNWQVAITAVWMSFVMADSFVSLTDALVRKTLKYWWWILWWIWMADDSGGGCCCQARVTPDSDQKENRKSDRTDATFGIPESTGFKKTLTDAISVKWGYLPPQVTNASANEHQRKKLDDFSPFFCSRHNWGEKGITHAFSLFPLDATTPNVMHFPQRDTCNLGDGSAGVHSWNNGAAAWDRK